MDAPPEEPHAVHGSTPRGEAARGFTTARPPRGLKLLFGFALLFMVFQLVLRQTRSQEMFPTFLLPSGASVYRTDVTGIRYARTDFLAVGPDGTETPFRLGRLLKGIPGSFIPFVARDEFGLRKLGPRGRDLRLGPLRVSTPGGVTTQEEREETQAWLRNRLESKLSHPVTSVRVVKKAYRMANKDAEEELVKTVFDKTIPLTPEGSFSNEAQR